MSKIEFLSIEALKDFKCIGSECPENCCQGWGIQVDKKTYKNYKKLNNSTIRKEILNAMTLVTENQTMFNYANMKRKDSKCEMLNENGLCKIQLNLGHDYLSETCKKYPRVTTKFDAFFEESLNISCPVVVDILFDQKEPLEFSLETKNKNLDKMSVLTGRIENRPYKYNVYFEIRALAIEILQNRNYPLWKRLSYLGFVCENIEKAIQENSSEEDVLDVVDSYKHLLYSNEIFDAFDGVISKDEKYEFYTSIVNTFLNVFNFNASNNVTDFKVKYENIPNVFKNMDENTIKNFLSNKYNEFLNTSEHLLEHFLVHQVYHETFPLKQKDMITAYRLLIIKYIFLQLLLLGVTNDKNNIDIIDLKNCVYTLARRLNHADKLSKAVENIFAKHNLGATQLTILMKN